MSIIETLREQEGHEAIKHEISNFMFDMLNVPLPESQNERFEYPKCPFCRNRPRLVTVKGADITLQIRTGSPLVITIPRYRVESCCSATYKVKHEGLSRSQMRRIQAQVKNVSSGR